MTYQPEIGSRVTLGCRDDVAGAVVEFQNDGKTAFVRMDNGGTLICQTRKLLPEGSPRKHDWYGGEENLDSITWYCSTCSATKRTASAARHLSNAIAAAYANVGPSTVIADIRTAMQLLEMEQISSTWTHWNARGEKEWEL